MGHGQLRNVSTISRKISSTTRFQTSSSTDSISPTDVQSRPISIDRTELKRRRSSARRSIYSIDIDFGSDATDDDKPVPPDGGYGWVIVIAVHFIQAMGMGFLTSLGIFYIEWREYFDSSAAETGLVVSLSSVVIGVISPMAVRVAVLIGSRPLVMSGAFIVFLGLLVTSFATSVTQLMLTVGVFTAFGYGIICGPAIMVIADYFDENFALANGIAFSGVSIGQLIFPPLSVEFIYWFGGWKGAMFIISALLLNIAVFGALLRPVKKANPVSDKKAAKSVTTPTTYQNAGFEEDPNYPNSIPSTSSCEKHMDRQIIPSENQNELPILNKVSEDKAVPHIESQLRLNDVAKTTPLKKYQRKLRDIMKKLVTFLAESYGIPGVFRSPLFVLMIPAVICLATGWFAIVTHQAARAISVGVSEEDASLLLSVMGIGSLVGRLSHGWFIDRGFITSEICLVISLGVCSAATFLVCFVNLFPVLAILATIQGMTAGIGNTLTIVIIKSFSKPTFEDTAVGMLYMIWGFGDLIGGVVAGYLYDVTDNYNVSFYFAGTSLAATTILVYLACVLKDRIVAKLYRKLALRQLENARYRSERQGDLDNSAEEYDNEAFTMENEELEGISKSGSRVREHGRVRPMFQIEIHDSWERACSLPDTNV